MIGGCCENVSPCTISINGTMELIIKLVKIIFPWEDSVGLFVVGVGLVAVSAGEPDGKQLQNKRFDFIFSKCDYLNNFMSVSYISVYLCT